MSYLQSIKATSMLLTTPLPINDWSGGLTENFIQGGTTKYAAADNFIHTVNRKLETRYGSAFIDPTNYILPSGNSRVGTLINFDNNTAIFAQSGPNIYWYGGPTGSWNAITGPNGNIGFPASPALPGNPALPQTDPTNTISWGMFQHQMYITNDSSNGNVAKIYIDQNNNYQTRTAGLPALPSIPNYTPTALLSTCIAIANNILTNFLAHVNSVNTLTPFGLIIPNTNTNNTSYGNTSGPNGLHLSLDNVSSSLLTQAVPATNLTNLITLCGVLASAYNTHILDAQLTAGSRSFHFPCVINYGGYTSSSGPTSFNQTVNLPSCLNISQSAAVPIYTAPTVVTDETTAAALIAAYSGAAAFLDDLLTKYKMHIYAPFTHDYFNNCAIIGVNLPQLGHINYVSTGPIVTPNLTPLFTIVNAFIEEYNQHIASTTIHVQVDAVHAISCPAPIDSDSLYIAIAHCRAQYNQHQFDSLWPTYYGSGSSFTGGFSGYIFGIAASTIGIGTVYTNNGQTFTVVAPTSPGGTLLYTTGTGAPSATGTLTYSSGPTTGNITFASSQAVTNGSGTITNLGPFGETPSGLVNGNPSGISEFAQIFGNGCTVIDLTAAKTYFSSNFFTTMSAVTQNIGTQVLASFTLAAPGVTSVTTSSNETGGIWYQWSQSSSHWAKESNTAETTIPTDVLTTAGVDLASWASILSTVVTAYNAHDASVVTHNIATQISSNFLATINTTINLTTQDALLNSSFPVATITSLFQENIPVPGVSQYVYGFHFFDSYIVGNLTFDVVGPVTFIGPIETCSIVTNLEVSEQAGTNFSSIQIPTAPVTISKIPSLPYSSSGTNYDLTNISINACRTIDAGTTLYQLALVPNGTSVYVDSIGDNSATTPGGQILTSGEPIYTTGGVVNFDPAPMCKYMHIFNGIAWYGGIWDTGQFFANRVRQSVAFAPDSSPRAFFDDLDDIVSGISSTRTNLIVFCLNSTYQLQGQFNTLGQGSITHQRISDTAGCIAPGSIVKTEIGVFFAGNDGFYYTDGTQCLKISSEINKTYLAMTQNAQQVRNIRGAYDKWHRRIWWSTQPNPGDYDVSQSFILHLDYGVSAQSVFTTASNFDYYRPASMLFFENVQYSGDARGYILQYGPLYKSDVGINPSISVASWNNVYIPWTFSSCAVDFGSTFNRKWVPRIAIAGKNVGNVAIEILSINDLGKSSAITAPMLYNQNLRWGTPGIIWGSKIVWNSVRQPDMWRRFPSGQMRLDFKQITLTPSFIGIYNSEQFPVGASAVVTQGMPSTGGTVVMNIPSGYTTMAWPADVVGYAILFASDGYTANYPITALSMDQKTITISIPKNGSPAAVPNISNQAWEIWGIPLNGALSLTAINMHYALMGKMQDAYQGPQSSGANT